MQLIQFSNGTYSLYCKELQEAMHSSIGPSVEAQVVYIDQMQLLRRMRGDAPFIVFDIGLGIAANAICLFQNLFQLPFKRAVQVYSIEPHLEGITFALAHLHYFPFLSPFVFYIKKLLQKGEVFFQHPIEKTAIHWILLKDFYQNCCQYLPAAEVILLDLYSPQKTQDWSLSNLQVLYQNIQPQTGLLVTYCAASSFRRAAKLTGFMIQKGQGTILKRETTLAWKP